MQAAGGRIVVNPAFKDWVYEDEEPDFSVTLIKRQITYHVERLAPLELNMIHGNRKNLTDRSILRQLSPLKDQIVHC